MSVLGRIIDFVVNLFLGCHHSRLTRPFTIGPKCYMVCLDCGSHRFYSTETMRPLGFRESRRLRATLAATPEHAYQQPGTRAYPKPHVEPRPAHAGPWLVRRRNPKIAA